MGESTLVESYPTIVMEVEGSGALAEPLSPADVSQQPSTDKPLLVLTVTEHRKLSLWEQIRIGALAAWEVLGEISNIPQEADSSRNDRLGFRQELQIGLLAAWEVFVWLMLYVGTSRQEEMDPSRRN